LITLHFVGGPLDQQVKTVPDDQIQNNQVYAVNVMQGDQMAVALHTCWAFKSPDKPNHAYAVCHPGAPQIVTSAFRFDTELYGDSTMRFQAAAGGIEKQLRQQVTEHGFYLLEETIFHTVEDDDTDPRIKIVSVQAVAVTWETPLNQ